MKDLSIHCWCCIMIVLLWIVHCYENDHLFIIYANMSFALVLRLNCKKYCELRKNKKLKRIYHFEGRVVLHDIYYGSTNVSHASTNSINERRVALHNKFYYRGCVTCRNACMYIYVPHCFRTEKQWVCIIRSDIHHYTWHWIA